jgi:hypothetical protein
MLKDKVVDLCGCLPSSVRKLVEGALRAEDVVMVEKAAQGCPRVYVSSVRVQENLSALDMGVRVRSEVPVVDKHA